MITDSRPIRGARAVLLTALLASCSDATGVDEPGAGIGERAAGGSRAAPAIADALAANVPPRDHGGDYAWDASSAVTVTLNGRTIAAQGAGVSVSGGRLTITAPGTYVLRGRLADGQVVVNSTTAGVVRLVLDGADIHSSRSAPIQVAAAEAVTIVLADGSSNALSDGKKYALPSGTDEPNATLFSVADLAIGGNGSLAVDANFDDAIASKEGLVLDGGTISITSVDDGIRGRDYLVMRGGTVTAKVGGDGLKSDGEDDPKAGYVYVTGGEANVTAGGDAVQGASDVLVEGGTLTLSTRKSGGRGASRKGLKAASWLIVEGGTIAVDAADDALHSNAHLALNGADIRVATGDDGVHADSSLTITAGTLRVAKSYEGIEAPTITITGGDVTLVSSDDGINGAKAPHDAASLRVTGGRVAVDAGGDGIDVNGSIVMTGGTVIVHGPTTNMNSPLDFNVSFRMMGGLLVAAGSAEMAKAPGTTSTQPAILLTSPAMKMRRTMVHIRSSSGEEILSFVPAKHFQSLAFSSPALERGVAYGVYTGGSSTGAGRDGVYSGGAYSGGTKAGELTTTSMVTRATF